MHTHNNKIGAKIITIKIIKQHTNCFDSKRALIVLKLGWKDENEMVRLLHKRFLKQVNRFDFSSESGGNVSVSFVLLFPLSQSINYLGLLEV